MPYNENQIRALANYIQSQNLINRVPSPSNYGVIDAIKKQAVIAPTANDFRKLQADVALNSQLGGEWWKPTQNPEGYRPLARKKTVTESTSPLFVSKDEAVQPQEPEYEINQPTYYTPGFENYLDPWVAWENAWGETYTPQ